MKNDTTFVLMRSGDYLGDAKMSKWALRSVEFKFFINCDRHKRFSQNERRRADLQNVASYFLIFTVPQDLGHCYYFLCFSSPQNSKSYAAR